MKTQMHQKSPVYKFESDLRKANETKKKQFSHQTVPQTK